MAFDTRTWGSWPRVADQATLDAINAAIAAAVPVGVVLPYAGQHDNLPTGWLLCDGSQVSRTQYLQLFNVLGVTHGGGGGDNDTRPANANGAYIIKGI
jgi:microcystin-dependent protein